MRRRGTVLVAVLVIVALAALAAAALMFRAQAEVSAAAASSRQHQAYTAALSGLQRAISLLKAYPHDPEMWYDNPDMLQNQFVADDGTNTWYFTVYAYNAADTETVRNGVIDEAGKVNLNVAPEQVLLALPNLTYEQVDCLLDYRDGDSETREQGAEQDYYDQLAHPYMIKNGLLGTVEELLLVKGFDARTVYGEDYNLNGLLEDNEDDGDDSFPPDNGDGELNRGLLGVATIWSYEFDVDNEGNPRVSMNGGRGLEQVGLSDQTIEFIQLYVADGNPFTHPSQLLEMRYELKRDQRGHRRGESIESGVGAEDLPIVLDKLTVLPGGGRRPMLGLINVNTASVAALTAVLQDEELARRIVGARPDAPAEGRGTTAWLYTENVVTADRFKEIAPRLTARSFQYRVRCVGYGWPCGQFRVIEAIVDVAAGSPRMLYQRDLTRLGIPFAIDAEQLQRE